MNTDHEVLEAFGFVRVTRAGVRQSWALACDTDAQAADVRESLRIASIDVEYAVEGRTVWANVWEGTS